MVLILLFVPSNGPVDILSPPGGIIVAGQNLFQEAGIELHYQPPYSPDFNPIELMWSKVKNSLRTAKARTQEQLYEAIAHALAQITSSDTQGFFRHCNVAIES